MATSILFYYNILQLYFGVAIAVFIAAQPLLILITSASHAVEVWAKSRGWKRLNTCAYWVAKFFGTISAIDARNVQRAGGKVFEILAALLAALPNTKAVKSINKGAMTMVLIAGMASLPLAQGCAGTFEEARIARPSGIMAASPPSARCVALSDREYWFDVASYGTGAAGVGAVLSVIPASEKYDSALVISGAAAGAISVVSGFASQHAATVYVREGCAK